MLINTDNTIRGNGNIRTAITNQGTIRAESGTLIVNRDITGNGTVAAAAGGLLSFNGTTLQAGTVIVDPAGTFDFNGSRLEVTDFVGDLDQDQGTYAPGPLDEPGNATVSGDYTMTSSATLEIQLGGTGQASSICCKLVATRWSMARWLCGQSTRSVPWAPRQLLRY